MKACNMITGAIFGRVQNDEYRTDERRENMKEQKETVVMSERGTGEQSFYARGIIDFVRFCEDEERIRFIYKICQNLAE